MVKDNKMMLYINFPEKKLVPFFNIPPLATISTLKKHIEQKVSIPMEFQVLLYNGKILDNDSSTVQDYNIQQETILRLELDFSNYRRHKEKNSAEKYYSSNAKARTINIQIRPLCGGSDISIENVDISRHTVGWIKQKILAKEGIEPHEFCLTYKGKLLQETDVLTKHGYRDFTYLHLCHSVDGKRRRKCP